MQYIVQFNIANVIFVKDGNQFYLPGDSCCQKFEMMTLCSWPLTNRLWQSMEDYATHPPHTHTYIKVIAISAPLYYVVCTGNDKKYISTLQ